MKKILETLKLKWTEYLLEIIVIIIGVLGAFALNNWNEQRKDRALEQVILRQLQEEYLHHREQLDQKIDMRNFIIRGSFNLLKILDNPDSINEDSLIAATFGLSLVPTFDPVMNDIIESGNIRLIRDPKLRQLLSMWTSEVIQVQEEEQRWLISVDEDIKPILAETGIIRTGIDMALQQGFFELNLLDSGDYDFFVGESAKAPNLELLLSSRTFESYVAGSISLNSTINEESAKLRELINEILDLVESNIK